MGKKKKTARKLIAIAMAAAMCMGTAFMAPVSDFIGTSTVVCAAENLQEGAFSYSANADGSVTITKYDVDLGGIDAVIPATINDAKVTAIGTKAFAKSNVCTVKIPATVRYIGEDAFHSCEDLVSVDIFEGVTQDGVTRPVKANECDLVYIGKRAFKDCKKLDNAIIPDSVVYIDNEAFAMSSYFASFAAIRIGDSVSTVGYKAFASGVGYAGDKPLVQFKLGDSLKYIGNHAFSGDKFVQAGLVYIPSTVETIEEPAFWGFKGTDEFSKIMERIAAFDNPVGYAARLASYGTTDAFLIFTRNSAINQNYADSISEDWGMNLNHALWIDYNQLTADEFKAIFGENTTKAEVAAKVKNVSAVSDTSMYVGEKTVMTADKIVPAEEGEYTYKYTFTMTEIDTKKTFSKTYSNTKHTFTAYNKGIYDVEIKSQAFDTDGNLKAESNIYRKLVVSDPVSNEITMTSPETIQQGENVKFSLAAENGFVPDFYESQTEIYRMDDDSNLLDLNAVINEYHERNGNVSNVLTNNTYSVTEKDVSYSHTMNVPGKYKVVTYVKDAAERPVKKEFEFTVDGILNKSINLPINGIAEQFKAYNKDTQNIEYEIAVKAPSSKEFVTVKRDTVSSPNTTSAFAYTPKNSGVYQYRVTERLVNKTTGEVAETRQDTFTFNVVSTLAFEKCGFGTNTLSNKKTINSGTSATVTVKAKKGTGGYKYAVYYKKEGQTSWTTAQGFKAADSDSTAVQIPITPKSFGNYQVCVKVRDSEGSEVKKYLDLTVKELQNNSTISANSITFGKTVTVTGKAANGSDNYTYEVLYKKKSDSKWTTVQKFAANNSVTIKPKSATAYDVCVKVKDTKSGLITKKFFDLEVVNDFKNISTVSPQQIAIGKTVKITAKASGGTGSYSYAVLYKKKSETKWTTVLSFGTTTQATIKPKSVTDYDICVKVKDNNTGMIAKEFFDLKVTEPEYALVNNSTVSINANSRNIIAIGKAQYGAAENSSDYKYAVYYKLAAETDWQTAQNFSSNTEVVISPTELGEYDVCVKVKDLMGTIAKRYFTVKVTSLPL